MLAVETTYIDPTPETHILVGPEGTVMVEPALGGDPFILAANTDGERVRAAMFIKELLDMGLVPYGLPLNHKANVALFGGSVLRDCGWVRHGRQPQAVTEDGRVVRRLAVIALPTNEKANGPSLRAKTVRQ
jgi:hypothetical protein